MTSWKPPVIPVLQPSGFETFTVINGIQFEKKFKSKEFFYATDFDRIWSLHFQAANHIHK